MPASLWLDKEIGLHNYRARYYDDNLGRFLAVDPQNQFPSPYIGMGNNPISNIDPNGERSVKNFLANYTFLKPAFQLADVISIYNNEGSSTARGQAGQYMAQASIEAGVALATAGVGSVVGSAVMSGAISQLGGAAIQAGAHGVINGSASALQGGSFARWFALGALSSASGSALANQSALVQFGGSVVTGGITSKISGGTFAEGAITAGIISGANHLGHEISQYQDKKLIEKFLSDGITTPDGKYISRKEMVLTFNKDPEGNGRYSFVDGKHNVNFDIQNYEVTIHNVKALAVHEIYGHGVMGYGGVTDHFKAYISSIDSKYWGGTTATFKSHVVNRMYEQYYLQTGTVNLPTKYLDIFRTYQTLFKK